jgi:hypothetical protein
MVRYWLYSGHHIESEILPLLCNFDFPYLSLAESDGDSTDQFSEPPVAKFCGRHLIKRSTELCIMARSCGCQNAKRL